MGILSHPNIITKWLSTFSIVSLFGQKCNSIFNPAKLNSLMHLCQDGVIFVIMGYALKYIYIYIYSTLKKMFLKIQKLVFGDILKIIIKI